MRIVIFILAYLFGAAALASGPDARVLRFVYEIPQQQFPLGQTVDMYIPLPAQESGQRILDQTLQSSLPGESGRESVYGNTYYHLHRSAESDTPISARLSWIIARDATLPSGPAELTPEERARALAPDALVPVGDKILQPILAEIRAQRTDDSPAATARAIYDWVVDNVEYKKVGTGWGNGDTFWACTERYGNCTDFHSLFISLARTEGIPARFEIGFPIPEGQASGEVSGYHCWVKFFLPERGWVPIDASEAAKHPERREELFGSYPADRIHFTTGRDLVISPGSVRAPLNYFIYPYVEIGGKPWKGKVDTRFSYTEVKIAAAER